MNETLALDSYLNIGIPFILIVFVFILIVISTGRAKKFKKLNNKISDELKKVQNELGEWQVLPELFKRTAYSLDLEQNLDILASHLLKALDSSSISFLLKNSQGYTFRARISGDVTKSYIIKSKSAITAAYIEFSDLKETDLLSEERVNGGNVIITDNPQLGQGIGDFLKQSIIPINYRSELLGVLGVFGSGENIDQPETKDFLTKALDMTISLIDDYRLILNKERGKLESVLQSMEEGVLLFDYDYKVSVINKTASVFLACENNRPGNISEISLLLKGCLPIQEVISGVMDSGESKSLKRIFINERYLSFTFMPVTYEREIIGVGVIMHNDSEEERLSNLREDFTAMVVHELRAPLTVIRGSADMILQNRDKFTQQDIDIFLNQIKSSAWDLLKLVSDLLDSAKIESGKFTVNKSPCLLNKVLEQEVENYKVFTESKNIDLVLDLSDAIPSIEADKEKIVQVLNNLLSNAVKFTYKGEITHMGDRGFIKVGSRLQEGFLQIFVADNGPGIPNEVKKQLFNKFVQARESQISNESGTGLGLVIAKGIVEAHGGKIWVEDNVPKGSVFIFTLPV